MAETSSITFHVFLFFMALIIMGLSSIGPIMTTWSGTAKCNENDKRCDYKKENILIQGIIFLIVVFSILYSILWALSTDQDNLGVFGKIINDILGVSRSIDNAIKNAMEKINWSEECAKKIPPPEYMS